MSNYKLSFINFSKDLMEKQGTDIRRWANDPNHIIADAFKSVIDAAQQAP